MTRHSPELLKAGCWKYKPNGFELSQLSDDENMWMQDDVTLKVEALKGEPHFLQHAHTPSILFIILLSLVFWPGGIQKGRLILTRRQTFYLFVHIRGLSKASFVGVNV